MNLDMRQIDIKSRRIPYFYFTYLILFILLTGCFGGGNQEETENVAPVENQFVQKTLTCSEACANNGQCGQAGDGSFFVLARSDQPNTQNHDQIFPVDTSVDILGSEQRLLQSPGGEVSQLTFSYINISGGQKSGWVANWCILEP